MSVYLFGALWVLGAAALACGLAVLVRKKSSKEHHDNQPLNTVLSLIGGLHAVLMVFVLIGLFDGAGAARAGTYREADGLVAVSWAADSLPEPARTRIHELTRAYTTTVLDQEGPRMRSAEPVDDAGWSQLGELQNTIDAAPAGDDWRQERRIDAKDQLWQVYQARQDRLAASTARVNVVVWFALVIGSLATVTLADLVSGLKASSYLIMVSIVASVIALLLYAIYQLQNPFAGGANVSLDAFRAAFTRLG
jgi:hypothetical protein